MELEIDKYEDIYRWLKKCFEISFGDGKRQGLISMNEVKNLVDLRRKPDYRNNMPKNSLIEIPKNLYGALKNTYISRDPSYVNGIIGCAETTEEQSDGITNMALLMYLSNHLAKQYKFRLRNETNSEKIKICKKNEGICYRWKDIALTDIIASIYVLSKTSEEYDNYFSYGSRIDDDNNPTFVIDLPYIGQLCVHFGGNERKKTTVNRAQDTAKSILEKKFELGQITVDQLRKITSDLEKDGILPKYDGKLYEYVGAMPIEYIGDNIKKYRKIIGNKLPEQITSEDIKLMTRNGLNERELYYFFIKIGAPKKLLNEISGANKKISHQSVEEAISNITIEEFKEATQNLRNLTIEKGQKETEHKF